VHNDSPDSNLDALLDVYEAAVLAFNAASSTLVVHLAARALPADAEIQTEENARADVVAARRQVWAAYVLRNRETNPRDVGPLMHDHWIKRQPTKKSRSSTDGKIVRTPRALPQVTTRPE